MSLYVFVEFLDVGSFLFDGNVMVGRAMLRNSFRMRKSSTIFPSQSEKDAESKQLRWEFFKGVHATNCFSTQQDD